MFFASINFAYEVYRLFPEHSRYDIPHDISLGY